MRAAHANAETTKVPVVQLTQPERQRPHAGLLVAAGVVVIGAAALTMGVLSVRSSTVRTDIAGDVAALVTLEPQASSAEASTTDIAADSVSNGEQQLAHRIHEQVAASLPRVQAATPLGMREGSGLFVTSDGHIATSAGLVAGAEYVLAWTQDGRRWRAAVVASDPFSDVAVLQIESDEWPAVSLDSGDSLWAGQYALAIDHNERRISFGEVTAVNPSHVQVDQPAALPGSAIVDDTGSVIAMVTNDGSNANATPAWLIEQVAVDLISSGSTTHPWLGLFLADGTDEQAVLVQDVVDDSPAHHAGLEPGDVIDSIDGATVSSAQSLWRHVQSRDPGHEVVLTVSRDGERHILLATLAKLDN